MADRPEMFGPTGVFREWPIQWNHAKCCGADPCCHDNDIWARRGDPFAYRLVQVIAAANAVVVCSDERGTGLLERITGDHRSLLQLQLYDISDRDSGNPLSLLLKLIY